MEYFKCKTCETVFTETEIENSQVIRRSRSGILVKFPDGTHHDVRKLTPALHERWHKQFGVNTMPGCWFCKLDREEKFENERLEDPQQKEGVSEEASQSKSSHADGSRAVMADDPPAEIPESKPGEFNTLRFAFTNWSR